MRIWSIHPSYLDSKGLVALWRESLLAQNVLHGNTKGYKYHPQLTRFKEVHNPAGAIASYLQSIYDESKSRDYNFNQSKIGKYNYANKIPVTTGQLRFEFNHLLKKLQARDNGKYDSIRNVSAIKAHPLFNIIDGTIEKWEIV